MNTPEIEEAYRRYFPVIRAKCTRMLRDSTDAQDVAQETFARLWARRNDLRDAEALLAWIYRTATRLAVDRIRSDRVATSAILREPVEGVDITDRIEARQALDAFMRRLGRRELEILLLSRVDGLTQDEIARVLRISDRTVRRALRKIDDGARRATRLS